jgi:hypothetical protein
MLRQVLLGSFDANYQVDVFSNGVRVLKNVPVTDVQMNDDASSLVQTSGSLTIAYQDDFGASIAPLAIGDVLSPFGTQVRLSLVITDSAAFVERVQLGLFLISGAPVINATWRLFNGAILSDGDVIQINFKDLFARTQRNTFAVPGSPPSLASTWAEVQRLTQLPITRSIADAAISSSITYQQDRLQAVYDLATGLDATACLTADGTVSMRPNAYPAVVDTIVGGDGGTLISAPRAMANDTVYNRIDVVDTAGNILGSAQITTGQLRAVNPDGSLSPYGTVPYRYSSPLITTAAQANAFAAANLPRVSTLRAQVVVVTEVMNPLRDLGDVVTVKRMASGVVVEQFTGRVTKITRTTAKTQQTTLAVGQ